jgi:hypothetical protein
VKTNLGNVTRASVNPAQFPTRVRDDRILIDLFLAMLMGILSYVATVITTVVESGGFWQYFWLGICIAAFVTASFWIVRACGQFR